MHAQIKRVIERLVFHPGKVYVELSATQSSPLGLILFEVYYNTKICDIVSRDDRHGYPHNGGQHTFSYKGRPGDVVALLETIKEEVGQRKLNEETRQVLSELSFISQEILARKGKM